MADDGTCRFQAYDTSASGNQTAFTVDLQTATITASPVLGGQATNTSASITPVGNGWSRVVCTVTLSTSVETTVTFRAYLSNSSGTGTSYGDGTGKGIYLWGAQIEFRQFGFGLSFERGNCTNVATNWQPRNINSRRRPPRNPHHHH